MGVRGEFWVVPGCLPVGRGANLSVRGYDLSRIIRRRG